MLGGRGMLAWAYRATENEPQVGLEHFTDCFDDLPRCPGSRCCALEKIEAKALACHTRAVITGS